MNTTVDAGMTPELRRMSKGILYSVMIDYDASGEDNESDYPRWQSIDALAADFTLYSDQEDLIRELIEALLDDASPLKCINGDTADDDSCDTADDDSYIILTDPVRVNAYLSLLERNQTDPIEQVR